MNRLNIPRGVVATILVLAICEITSRCLGCSTATTVGRMILCGLVLSIFVGTVLLQGGRWANSIGSASRPSEGARAERPRHITRIAGVSLCAMLALALTGVAVAWLSRSMFPIPRNLLWSAALVWLLCYFCPGFARRFDKTFASSSVDSNRSRKWIAASVIGAIVISVAVFMSGPTADSLWLTAFSASLAMTSVTIELYVAGQDEELRRD